MKKTRVRIGIAAAVVAAGSLLTTAQAQAQAQDTVEQRDAAVQSIDYIWGSDVTLGSCKAWMNRRSSDNYVQGIAQSWGADCWVTLQRRKANEIDWSYVASKEVQQSKASTGFYWNGRDTQSRVCIYNVALGGSKCGGAAW